MRLPADVAPPQAAAPARPPRSVAPEPVNRQEPGFQIPASPAWMTPPAQEPVLLPPHGAIPARERGLQQPSTLMKWAVESYFDRPPQPPHGAVPAEDLMRPEIAAQAEKEKKKPLFRKKDLGKATNLSDYNYALSVQERERVQREQPGMPNEKTFTGDRAVPLTQEAYEKLSFDQKGGVDFNTLLIQARENDLVYNDPSQYTQSNIDAYNRDVESIFGAGGGSDTMAFNTVRLLKTINFKAVGQDLDEFLSLERGISMEELENFKFSKEDVAALESFDMRAVDKAMTETPISVPGSGGRGGSGYVPRRYSAPVRPLEESSDESRAYANVRTPENMAAIDSSLIRGALNAYKRQLAAGGVGAWDMVSALSGDTTFSSIVTPVGYGRRGTDGNGTDKTQYDAAIEQAFGIIAANPNKDGVAALNDFFAQYEFNAKDKQELWNYIDQRTRRDLRYMGQGSEYAAPLREFLGWE